MSQKKHDPLIQQCMDSFEAKSVLDLSNKVGVAYNTMSQWNNKGPSPLGKVLLETLIENKHLRDSSKALAEAVQKKNEAERIKVEAIRAAEAAGDEAMKVIKSIID